jgi:hypothetical protein
MDKPPAEAMGKCLVERGFKETGIFAVQAPPSARISEIP